MILSATVWTRSEPCRPCADAKRMLADAGIGFAEIVVDEVSVTRRGDFWPKFGDGATFPQVILDGMHVGGLNELKKALPVLTVGHGI